MKEFTCIICPRGCRLTINETTKEVTGNTCIRGKQYALQEMSNPVRTITTSIRVNNLKDTLVCVKTSKPVPKCRVLEAMEEINKLSVNAPTHIGQVVKSQLLGLDIDVVITKEIM